MKDTFILSGLCISIALMMLLPILVIVLIQLRKQGRLNIDLRRGRSLKRLLLILAVVVVGIGVFAVAAEYVQDSSAYRKGVQACQAEDFLTAVDFFDRIIFNSRFTDIGKFLDKASDEKVSCFDQMAAVSKTNGDYGMALVAYAGLIASSADQSVFESARTEVETIFTQNDPASLANIEICELIDILKEQSVVPQQETTLPPLYLACGRIYLQEREDFKAAIDTYQLLIDQYPDSEAASSAAEELEATYYAASLDTGEYGKSLIRDSWAQVCDSEPATSPAVGLVQSEPGKAWFGGSEFELPGAVQASSPGQFHYAICIERGVKVIESCFYSGGVTSSRGKHWLSVDVRDTRTTEVISAQTFFGSNPRDCPKTVTEGYKLTGSNPSNSSAFDWVMEILDGIITGQ